MIRNFIQFFIYCMLFCGLINACSENGAESNEEVIPSIPGYTLVWNDEFDGAEINLQKWEHEVNGLGGGNNELQYYTDRSENSFIEGGSLVIRALNETFTGSDGTRNYTSGRLRTANKGDWKYVRIEVRAKLPYGQGIWPAVWMLPTDWEYGGWPLSGEIDIMELLGHQPNRVYGTLHYGNSWPNNVQSGNSYTLPAGDFSTDYHVFTLEWEENEIRWFVDGLLYAAQNFWFTSSAPYPAPFDKRFHMLLNVAVGGNWPGSPDESTIFPQEMRVDYVRVYEKLEE